MSGPSLILCFWFYEGEKKTAKEREKENRTGAITNRYERVRVMDVC